MMKAKINPKEKPVPDAETARALKLWVVLARSFNAVAERARTDIAGFGLNTTEFAVLEVLYHKGPLLLGEVGRRMLLTSGSITYVMDKLEKQGLLRRAACPKDRRATYAELTEAGRARIETIFPQHAAIIRDATAGLDAEEQEMAIRLLRKLGTHAQLTGSSPEEEDPLPPVRGQGE